MVVGLRCAEQEGEDDPADHGDQDEADQPVDERGRHGLCGGQPRARGETVDQRGIHIDDAARGERNGPHRLARRERDEQPGQLGVGTDRETGGAQTRHVGEPVHQRPHPDERPVLLPQLDRLELGPDLGQLGDAVVGGLLAQPIDQREHPPQDGLQHAGMAGQIVADEQDQAEHHQRADEFEADPLPDQRGAGDSDQRQAGRGDHARENQLPGGHDRARAPAPGLAVGERGGEDLARGQRQRHRGRAVDHRHRFPLADVHPARVQQLLLHPPESTHRHRLQHDAQEQPAPVDLGERAPGFVQAGPQIQAFADEQREDHRAEHPLDPPEAAAAPGRCAC